MATAYEYLKQYDSPNFTPAAKCKAVYGRPRKITAITIHHWGVYGQDFNTVVQFLCRKGGNSSAHYVIEGGKVACLVKPADVAWHCGSPVGNPTTVGLELRPEATAEDYETAAQIIRELRSVYGDLPLVPHSKWKATACPGEWDLERLDKLARKAAPAPAPAAKTHTVKRGETLSGIAKANGTTVAALVKKNGIKNADLIRVGQKIKL